MIGRGPQAIYLFVPSFVVTGGALFTENIPCGHTRAQSPEMRPFCRPSLPLFPESVHGGDLFLATGHTSHAGRGGIVLTDQSPHLRQGGDRCRGNQLKRELNALGGAEHSAATPPHALSVLGLFEWYPCCRAVLAHWQCCRGHIHVGDAGKEKQGGQGRGRQITATPLAGEGNTKTNDNNPHAS